MEEAMDNFDLQGSNDLVQDWIQEAETSERLLHQLEPQLKVQKQIDTGVVNKLIKYIHGKNEGKNEGPITTLAGQVSYVLSKVCEDDTEGIAAELKANLRSAKEEIETNKVRMQELTQKRTNLIRFLRSASFRILEERVR